MIRKRSKITLFLFSFGLPLICLAVLFGMKVDLTISTFFEVHPSQKWVLSIGPEGQITSSITDFSSLVSNNISVVQFERGESMNFHLVPSLLQKSALVTGDSVAVLSSSLLQERLVKLKGDLLIAQADLAAQSIGEKQSLIDEGKKRVEYSEAAVKGKKIPYDRNLELLKKGYISKQEFDETEFDLRQAELEHEINRARLAVTTTGGKEEYLQVLRMRIQAYRGEIDLLENRLRDFIIRCPVSGEIVRNYSKDTVLIVNNASRLILSVPIRYEKAKYLNAGDSVRIALKNMPEEIAGVIVGISKQVEKINGIQILTARISIGNNGYRLVPGLTVGGEIVLAPVTMLDYVKALFDN
jgi:hypothetical protein